MITSIQLIGYIELWVAEDVTVSVQGVRLRVDSTCPVSISSFDDPECQCPEGDDMSRGEESFSPAIIGGIAAAVVLAASLVVTAIIAFVLVKRYHARTTPNSDHTW